MSSKLNKETKVTLKDSKQKRVERSHVAVSRGKRLRFLRNITGMIMEVFGHRCGVSRTTINCWEQGINCLTERGAEKVVRAMREEGIRCTTLWLLQGIGDAPKIIEQDKLSKLNYQSLDPASAQLLGEMPFNYGGSDLEREIDLFKKCYPEYLIYCIQDNAMAPTYQPGDWVGGIKLPEQAMDLVHGMDCIVCLQDARWLVRRAKMGGLGVSKLSFYGINAETSVEYPPLRYIDSTEIIALAPIIRVWRKRLKTDVPQ